ncbi:hypothetical protein BHM03_00027083, partial [Ensete ventricosum]
MLQRASQYVAVESLVAEKREDHKKPRGDKPQGQPSGTPRRRDRPKLPTLRPLLIPLNSTRTEIRGRDKRRYCRFHRDYGHDTEECNDLRNQIKDLIRQGHLHRFVRDRRASEERPRRDRNPSPRPDRPIEKQIDVIVGGPASGGDSSSAKKAYTRSAVEKRLRSQDPGITFGEGDDAYSDHDNTLVISVQIANARVKRVMVDTGSSADILYFGVFQKLGLTDKDLLPVVTTLTGFTGDLVSPVGTTVLPIIVGEEPRSKTLLVSFIVVALPSAYNAIIGRPTLNKLRAVVSTYHRVMKFPTRAG